MKYVYSVIVYYVIYNLNKVSGGVIPNNQPFIYIRFKQLFM